MSTDQTTDVDGPDPGLQLIAAGITELLGFGAAAITIVRGEELVVAASSGRGLGSLGDRTGVTPDELIGERWPVSSLTDLLADAEVWGRFRYAPRYYQGNIGRTPWVADVSRGEGEDAWDRYDALVAPIYDDDGVLRGCIAVDDPLDGKLPDAAHREVLEKYAERTRRAVLLTLERERLAQRARNHRLAQEFLRDVTATLPLEDVIATVGEALLGALDADGLRLHASDPDGVIVAFGTEGLGWTPTRHAMSVAAEVTREAWSRDTYLCTDRAGMADHPVLAPYRDAIREVLDHAGAEHFMMVPLGVHGEPLGQLVVLRDPGRPSWTAQEGRLALELGRDLGQVVLRSNAYSRELALAARLRAADKEQRTLIDALVREIERPLSDLDAAVADVRRAERHSPAWHAAVAAVTTSVDATVGVVEDLLTLSQLSDASPPPTARGPVELVGLLTAICHAATPIAETRRVDASLEVPPEPTYVAGVLRELESAILHLVMNALSFTPAGGRVTLRLDRHEDEAIVSVADTGIGIPESEQDAVFGEFVRGADPAVQDTPGAGLGLTIVRRVAERHRARIELVSTPGEGTTVRLILPAGSPPA